MLENALNYITSDTYSSSYWGLLMYNAGLDINDPFASFSTWKFKHTT